MEIKKIKFSRPKFIADTSSGAIRLLHNTTIQWPAEFLSFFSKLKIAYLKLDNALNLSISQYGLPKQYSPTIVY